ncbi:MAG: asparagine synthase (glutamine-hydrolyzing) [Flavitalea sp.]
MCGIAGIVSFELKLEKKGLIEKMTSCLDHRGPDATGFFEDRIVALGHKRLSIIDLSLGANQPMDDVTSRYKIIFNGEIYNFREIRKLLPDYPFKTNSDTEVILAAFIKWGSACLQRLVGMYAFAIWDTELSQLFIARDRFGVKPLYYFKSEKIFLFSSEIRSLLSSGVVPRKLNSIAVSEFLQFGSVGDTNTIIENICSLEAGMYMTVDKSGVQKKRYWTLAQKNPGIDFKNYVEVKSRVRELLDKSVARRMISDVPIGAFLSGGIDSSAIVGLMAKHSNEKINTFTVAFKEREFDESKYAEQVSKKFNTQHNNLLIEAKTFLNELLPALDAMDSPTGDGVNSYVVAKAIRNTGITVALSGVGGDELFAGYPLFFHYLKIMKAKPLWKKTKVFRNLAVVALKNSASSKRNRVSQFLQSKEADIHHFYPAFRQIISQQMLSRFTNLPVNGISFLSKDFSDRSEIIDALPLLSQISVAEYSGYTRNTLLKDMDQMSMAVSLEIREPFFDHELVEFVLQVPDAQKFPSYPKKLLVDSLEGLIPEEIIHRKKQGFLFPWNKWMKEDLVGFCDKYIRDISKREFINEKALLSYWGKFLKSDPSVRWMEIWLFIVLEYWLQKNGIE